MEKSKVYNIRFQRYKDQKIWEDGKDSIMLLYDYCVKYIVFNSFVNNPLKRRGGGDLSLLLEIPVTFIYLGGAGQKIGERRRRKKNNGRKRKTDSFRTGSS